MLGKVKNFSHENILVIENGIEPNTYKAIAHLLGPGRESPEGVDADGVKGIGSAINGYSLWWKLFNVNTADVFDDVEGLRMECITCVPVSDNHFGPYTVDENPSWGVPMDL